MSLNVPRNPERRGEQADWRDPWPAQGVHQGDPAPSAGLEALRADGFAVCFDLESIAQDVDQYQDHLNNAAPVRMFNELRMAYVAAKLAPEWPRYVRRSGSSGVIRELHVQYESEAWPHESFVGATAYRARRGKSALMEQRLVEASSGRGLARAWIVQLLVGPDGRVEAFPEWMWDAVARAEGAPIPEWPSQRRPWGPPP
jgi:acyl-CoA thioesterase FadM